MSRKKKDNSDDLALSLTGSQIFSPGQRPISAKQLKRPNSLTDVRVKEKKQVPVNGYASGGDNDAGYKKKSSKVASSQRSLMSDRSTASSQPRTAKKAGDDFLALFESSVQPKIRGTTPKAHKPSPNAVKVLFDDKMSQRTSDYPSARSMSTTNDFEDGNYSPKSPINRFQQNHQRSYYEESRPKANPNVKSINSRAANESGPNKGESSPRFSNSKLTDNGTTKKSSGLNSITNNMTLQAMAPKTKASLSSMENSYQNIKPKTPVNQVNQGAATPVGRNLAENYIQTVNTAASKIQHWYRRHKKRLRASEAALKRLLENKYQERKGNNETYNDLLRPVAEIEENKARERKRVREEKAREARQQAIRDLHQKRLDKQSDIKTKAEEEIKYLQSSGKITKKPSMLTNKKKTPNKGQKLNAQSKLSEVNLTEDTFTDNLGPKNREEDLEDFFQSVRSPRDTEKGNDNDVARSAIETDANTEAAKTTLNDLFDTLKKLEEEEKLPTPRPKHNTWFENHQDSYLSADKLERLNAARIENPAEGLLSDEKLNSILTFLDEVKTADRLTDIDHELNKVTESVAKSRDVTDFGVDISHMEAASAAANEVTSVVLSTRLELDEKKRTVTMLQKALNQQRELTVRHAKETEKDMMRRIDLQKDEYEDTITRHLSFIDQLIDDKKALGEKCEMLIKDMKQVDKKYQDKIKATDERHGLEMQKVKELYSAAEKLRREKWIDDKTKKIKEMTVKGLEPEIQRLIAKHKSEMKKMKQIHEAELLQSDERAAQRYVKMTEELRDQLADEKEAACSRERELAKQRYEKQLQQEEESYQQQRRRLHSEVKEEKDRISLHGSRQRVEIDKLQQQLEDTHKQALGSMKSEFEASRAEQDRRHAREIQSLEERLSVEKEAWEENLLKKQESWLLQKERELKEQVRRDRDKEINLIISRLEEDTTVAREECERSAENKIKRIRDKYESEMQEVEYSERHAMDRYNEMKAQVIEVQGENERLKVITKQKDQAIADIQKMSEKLNKERDHVADIIRQEFADRLVATEEENRRVKTDMAELKAKQRLELERSRTEIEIVQKKKEEEMEEVHKRVKQAILKKEDVVNQLRSQYQAALKRADHLEGLLEQQRKQLLSK